MAHVDFISLPNFFILSTFLLVFSVEHRLCVEFDKRYTGVAFSAYVKRSENGQAIPGWTTYSLHDIQTMLEVIAEKFSRVATFGVGADNVPYERNTTYYSSNGQVYSAEAAALINRQRNRLALTMLVGIWQSNIPQQMETEFRLALESAHKANEIYPGTVQGLILSHNELSSEVSYARQALECMEKYKEDAVLLGLKLGSRQKCYDITTEDTGNLQKDKLIGIRRSIVNESDFLICEMEPAEHNLPSGGEAGFVTVKNDLLGLRNELRKINSNIEVMGQTGWPSKGKNAWENIDNLRQYWETANKWASKRNFTVWLFEAFDGPWKNWDPKSAHYGWWRLKQNSMVDVKSGYAEKFLEPPEEEPSIKKEADSTALSPWTYVGIAIGSLIVLFVLTLITLLFLRVNKLQESLTKDDVREFMYGVSDETAAQQGGDAVVESALKFPYDKSYEISKDKLKIKREKLLGTGQFGCVYKALIENEESTEVALKMAKSDCPKSALKGLLSEIKILTYLGKHPNIVSIHGAYTAEILNGVVYVATELCTLGSLENYLRQNQGNLTADRYANAPVFIPQNDQKMDETELITRPEVSFLNMVRWSHEIACGMEYLGTKHVVHADLSTRNVLLAADKTAKITDFGLSRRLYDYTNYVKKQQEPLPWRWMAIESLKRLEFSSKSDVWSFGVTLWEIFAMGDIPYPGLSWNLDFVDSLVNGLRMKCPPHATPEVYTIMVDCWHMEPNERPTFNDLKLSTAYIIENSI